MRIEISQVIWIIILFKNSIKKGLEKNLLLYWVIRNSITNFEKEVFKVK